MGPEFWVTVAASFIAGGAIGSSGILLAQWVLRKVDGPADSAALQGPEQSAMRRQVAHLGRQVRNVDARLDFAEQLLGGALPLAPAPSRLEPEEFEDPEARETAESEDEEAATDEADAG
jgi:hypothetical protein